MTETAAPKRIAVIGGGLSGMSAAFRLSELAHATREATEIVLFESGTRLGGLVGTERVGDYLVDTGADSFLTNKPGVIGLCRRLGIEDRLIPTDARHRGALVLFDGRAIPVPEGFQLLSPTAIWPILTSPIFSAWGKVRLLMERFVPSKFAGSQHGTSPQNGKSSPSGVQAPLIDESLASFVRRRFGREALDRLIQPLVGGIYTADPEELSLAATLPRFLEMERDYGSLIKASLRQPTETDSNSSTQPSAAQASTRRDTSSGARYGLFAGFKGGLDDLVAALRTQVETRCEVRLNSEIKTITECDSSSPPPLVPSSATTACSQSSPQNRYRLTFANGTSEQFSGLVIAASGSRMPGIIRSLDTRLSDELQKVKFASSAIVVSGHRLADIRNPLNAFGLVIPHVERRQILAVSFSSRKFPERAPAGRVILRTFLGGAMQPEIVSHTDEELIEIVKQELAETLGVSGNPDFIKVVRYPNAMPQYHVGHLNVIANIERLTREHPGLALAGISCKGVGIPDAITSGETAAETVFRDLHEPALWH